VFGYKDLVNLWKAERFNPEQLMALYKKAGAKYFVCIATHHDNFFLWKSQVHRWNSVNMGPQKDIVGLFQAAAKKEGLRFGVSEHLAASYTWFQTSHGADKTGPYAGVPYDGANPLYEDFYHPKADSADNGWLTTNVKNQKTWLRAINELVDLYHPDLLYSDSRIPFDSIGRQMLAHFYNENKKFNRGKLEAVYNAKNAPTNPMYVLDIERGKTDSITPYPWQTDTSIGPWFYKPNSKYKSASEILQMLVDIVSKNGNLLLNIVQTPEGDLEPGILKSLEDIGSWMAVNGEGIYGTRPWKIYGEGPSVSKKNEKGQFGGIKDFGDNSLTSADFRFTKKADTLYAFCLAKPTDDIKIISFGKNAKYLDKKIAAVSILGCEAKLKWKQTGDALVISNSSDMPDYQIITVKVQLHK
jgi:alpha-L-fucosidase